MDQKLRKIVLAALYTSLCCVATMIIQIPSPMTGYVNLGDCIVLISAWQLGPVYGALVSGVGSALADLLTGYTHYVPGTFVIKALMAVIACGVLSALSKSKMKNVDLKRTLSGLAAEIWMVIGYFLYSCLLLGKGLAASASIPGNLVQGAIGLVVALVLIRLLEKALPNFKD